MGTFLQILGAVFLLLLTLVAAVACYIWLKVRQLRHQLEQFAEEAGGAAAPVRRVKLSPALGYAPTPEAAEQVRALAAAGYEEIGAFRVAPMPVVLSALVHRERAAYGIVYEMSGIIWSDVVAIYASGDSFTASSSPHGAELDQRPGHAKRHEPGASVEVLLDIFEREAPREPTRAVGPDTFVEDFERAYAEEMDWRAARGGASPEELRRIAAGMDQEFDERDFEAALEMEQARAAVALEESCLEEFLRTAPFTAAQWEERRDRVLVVHDRMAEDEVQELLDNYGWDDENEQPLYELPEDLAAVPPREVARRLNVLLPPDRQFERLGEIARPVPADIYLTPE